ncbi:MarP family serine protease [Actinopolymorpha sp. B11F2]|uniref:MarP family serine protease n=1 Tax=Actinopolymorpha sp. B11F2 TaxID=3160862 RepID=UPI0032E4EB75
MNLFDVVLILVAVGYAVSGFRQGFLVGGLGVAGLIGGGVLGVKIAPVVLAQYPPSVKVSLAALGIVLGGALLGQALGAALGAAMRDRVTWRPAHMVDSTGGAVLSVLAMLLVAWILGSAVAGAQFGDVSRVVRTSKVLATVDQFMPQGAEDVLLAFSRVVDPSLFPRYLEPFAPEQIAPARPPTAAILRDADVERAAASVVRVTGLAPSCSRSLEGSGFVYGAARVMTNAHVVAGVTEPKVQTAEGDTYDAEVVLYDPDRDVAVLEVPDLPLRPLQLDDTADAGDQGAVLGYPENGPFSAAPARVRAEQRLQGPDIYGGREVVRNVFSLYAEVRPGNSGGPLVSPEGTVTGVIFAASVEDNQTGYALTIEEVMSDARAGRQADAPVSTGGCA